MHLASSRWLLSCLSTTRWVLPSNLWRCVSRAPSTQTDVMFPISWDLSATCRGQCWCTEWVGWFFSLFQNIAFHAKIYNFFHPILFPFVPGSEHSDFRPVLLCCHALLIWGILVFSPTVLFQRWALLPHLPLPKKVAHTTLFLLLQWDCRTIKSCTAMCPPPFTLKYLQ